jgi:uncharacterized protein
MRIELVEQLTVGFVVLAATAICWGCCKTIDRFAQAKFGKEKRPFKLRGYEIALISLGLAGVIAFFYSFAEPYQLETTFLKIASNKLKRGGGPVRIVHLTDLHCTGTKRNEDRLPERISALKPDLIVFSGDAADSDSGLRDFKELMNQLAKIAPVYGVGGNHDSRSGTPRDIFAGTRMVELNGESKVLEIKANKFWIDGVSVDKEEVFKKNFSPPPKDAFSIFLYHYPTGIDMASQHAIDLFCTGHTHGGQVRMPLYGALITMSPLGKKYEYGLYKVGNTKMFVSRGIGMTALPIRFLAPPEIAVLDIIPE